MSYRHAVATLCVLAAITPLSTPAAAQTIGTFRWQLLPFCNVVTLTVVQQGGQYQLDGSDDQCGAGQRASATGIAFVNPNGSIGLGLSIVTTPGGAPVHVDATISLASLSGDWRDSTGVSGAFVHTPGSPEPGRPPRSTPIAGDLTGVAAGTGLAGGGTSGDVALSVDFGIAQQRVTGTCGSGQFVTAINETGSVTCASDIAGGGDITAVMAGAGLTGGGVAGDVALAVDFAGTGAAITVARSDHTHAGAPPSNTSVGAGALARVTVGTDNTAIGSEALSGNTTGSSNTAVGSQAMWVNETGAGNVALGRFSLWSNSEGRDNVAIGFGSLANNRTGTDNIAIGHTAGAAIIGGSGNLFLGLFGNAEQPYESNVTYIRNVFGGTATSGAPVYVNVTGKLGTLTSSVRFKEDIADVGEASRLLQSLRPVTFHYKPEFDDGSRVKQFGLIAEEVAEVMPDLVLRDMAGEIHSIRYQFLAPLLVGEVQRLERERAALSEKVAAQAVALSEVMKRAVEQAAALAEIRTLLEDLQGRQR